MRRGGRLRASICCRQPGSTKTSSIAASMFRCCGCGANWRQTRRCRVSSRPNAAAAMSLQFLSNKAVWRISTASRKIAHGQGKPLHACVRTLRFELLRHNLGSGRPENPYPSCKFASSSVATAESLNLSDRLMQLRQEYFASDTDELPDRTPARFYPWRRTNFHRELTDVVLREFRCQSPVG